MSTQHNDTLKAKLLRLEFSLETLAAFANLAGECYSPNKPSEQPNLLLQGLSATLEIHYEYLAQITDALEDEALGLGGKHEQP